MMAKVWGKCGGITEDVTSARLGEPSVCSVFMHLDLVLWGGEGQLEHSKSAE